MVALEEKTCVEIYNVRVERTRMMMMRRDKNEEDDGVIVPDGVECVDGRL